jgi:hypothetical protein
MEGITFPVKALSVRVFVFISSRRAETVLASRCRYSVKAARASHMQLSADWMATAVTYLLLTNAGWSINKSITIKLILTQSELLSKLLTF